MARIRITDIAKADIAEAIRTTFDKYGFDKAAEYRDLIVEAQQFLAANPLGGVARPDIAPDARLLSISQRGRRARHVFLYRVLESGGLVELVAVPYDGMDLPRRYRPPSQRP